MPWLLFTVQAHLSASCKFELHAPYRSIQGARTQSSCPA